MAGAAEFRGNFNRAPESNSVALAAFGEFLVMPPGTAYGRKSHETYNYSTVSANTVMVHIRKLREKIGDDRFKTVKGVGYKFEEK